MMKYFLRFIFILFCAQLSAQLDLSLSQSAAICSSDGSINAVATGGNEPYQYRIVSGPELRNFQSSGLFQSLQPGMYAVEVRDASFDTHTETIEVLGSYALPELSVSFTDPSCSSSTNGEVILTGTNGNLIGTSAFPTYKYRIVDLSTIPQTVLQEQNTDTFSTLGEGTYTLQIEDGCQNIVSETVTLEAPTITALDGAIDFIEKVACDFYEVEYAPFGRGVSPHNVIVTEDLTGTTVFSGSIDTSSGLAYTLGANFSFGVDYTVNVVDACGQTDTLNFGYIPDMELYRRKATDCSGDTNFFVYTSLTGTTSGEKSIMVPATLTLTNQTDASDVVVYNLTDLNDLQVVINQSEITLGDTYDAVLEDNCKYLTTRTITFESLPSVSFSRWIIDERGCLDGTTSMGFSVRNGGIEAIRVTITSGPVSFTSEDGVVTNYTYPRVFDRPDNNSMYPTAFPPGSYEAEITDGCETGIVNWEILPSEVVEHDFSLDYLQSCGNLNSLIINPNVLRTSGNSFYTNVNVINTDTGDNIFRESIWFFTEGTPVTIPNLPTGNYQLFLEYQSAGLCSSYYAYTCPCEPQAVNVTIPEYVPTSFDSILGYTCTEGSGVILAQGANGVPPFQYEIIDSSVPANIGRISTDGVFENTDEGTYTIRITDSCGNSADGAFEVTPYLPSLVAACDPTGTRVTISANPVPDATFTWIDGAGIMVQQGTSNELIFDPFNATQGGNYTLQVTATGVSCTIFDGSITIPDIPCSSSIDVSKTVASGPIYDSNTDLYMVTYNITATNNGGLTGVYDLTDTFVLGTGITLNNANLSYGGENDGVDGVILSPFNSGDQIITGESLAGLRTESWLVTATFSVDRGALDLSQDCINSGGFGNQISMTGETDTTNNYACVPIEVGNIEITKDGTYIDSNANGLTDIGDIIDYTFIVTNTGNASLINIIVSDPLLGGTLTDSASGDTNSNGALDPTETWTYAASYAITQANIDNEQVNNLATASGEESDGNIITNTSIDPTPCATCIPDPSCADCTLTALPSNPSIDAVKNIETGPTYNSTTNEYTVTYRITVSNSGKLDGSYDVTDTFTLGTGLSLNTASLAYGGESDGTDGIILSPFTSGDQIITNESLAGQQTESWLVTATFSVNRDAFDPTLDCTNGGGFGNQITVTGDTDPSNNMACIPLDIGIMEIIKDGVYVDTDANAITTVGDEIFYTFEVFNTGNVPISNVLVSDPLLGGAIAGPISGDTDANGELDMIETWVYTATYPIVQSDIAIGQINNLATVSGDDPSGNIVSNTSTDPTPCNTCTPDPSCADCTLTELPNSNLDIALMKFVNVALARIGDEVNFTISVSNEGSITATSIEISEVLPNGFEYLSHSASLGNYDVTSGLWSIASLNSGQTIELSIRALVVDGTDYLNIARLMNVDQTDIDLSNNESQIEVEIDEPICEIFVYNSFSPQRNGLNEHFHIECIESYPNNTLEVFNRWGIKVFEQRNYDNTWNGISYGRSTYFANELLPVGTYYYILNLGDGSKVRAGWVYITG